MSAGLRSQTNSDISFMIADLGRAPTRDRTTSPLWNRFIVGKPVTRYFAGVAGFASASILTTVSLSPVSSAISSRIGASWRHGPHQSAQNSMRTGPSAFRTFSSKSASVTASTFATVSPYQSDVMHCQEMFGIQRGLASGSRRGHSLAVDVVYQITRCENAGEVRARRRAIDENVSLVV